MQTIKFPLKILVEKSADMIYVSQLDLQRILERALRRTDLPLYFTQGFNPRVKISFVSALALGREGSVETTFYFIEPLEFTRLRSALEAQLPQGLSVRLLD